MDMFLQEAIETKRFVRPRFKTMHYIAVLFSDGTVDYLNERGDLSPRRDGALEYDDVEEAELDCAILEARNFTASVETFQRYFQ